MSTKTPNRNTVRSSTEFEKLAANRTKRLAAMYDGADPLLDRFYQNKLSTATTGGSYIGQTK